MNDRRFIPDVVLPSRAEWQGPTSGTVVPRCKIAPGNMGKWSLLESNQSNQNCLLVVNYGMINPRPAEAIVHAPRVPEVCLPQLDPQRAPLIAAASEDIRHTRYTSGAALRRSLHPSGMARGGMGSHAAGAGEIFSVRQNDEIGKRMNCTQTAHPPQPVIAHIDASDISNSTEKQTLGHGRHDAGDGHGHSHGPLRTVFIAFAALVIALLVLYFGYNAAHNGRVYKGVSVLGTDLGGMTFAEASAAIEKAGAGYPSDSVTVNGSGHTWTLAPSDLGLRVDVEKTLDAAQHVGRSGGFLDNTGSQLGALFGGAKVSPILEYDPAMLDTAVARIASDVDRPAVDSKLDRDAVGKVVLTSSSSGALLDRAAVRAAIDGAVALQPFKAVSVSMSSAAPKVTEAALKASESEALLISGQPITLVSGKHSWTVEAKELGHMLSLTPADGGTWDVSLDEKALADYLAPIADKLKVDPEDAKVVLGKDKVTLKEDVSGQELDVVASIATIRKASLGESSDARSVELPTKEISASVHTAQVQALYDRSNALVTKGVRLWYGDDGYILRGSSVIGFIDVAPLQGGPGEPKLVVDQDVLADRISGVAYNFNKPAADARFRLVDGKPTRVNSGTDGIKVDVNKTLDTALKAIEGYKGGDRLQVELQVDVTKPKVSNADIASIDTPDLLGKGVTSFQGSSPERAWNVTFGAKKIDGALVPPGGVFSTVDTIGELTLDAGFKMGYMIVNDGGSLTTVPAEAGGICQVATTLFQAAFWGGLPMVERNWHSYWIGSYGIAPTGLKGLDATIAPPEKDFRFKNNTGNWILIRASADNGILTFKIFGTDQGWKITASDPVITNIVKTDTAPIVEETDKLPEGKTVLVEHAQDGFSATITRTVRDKDGAVIDTWVAKSKYAPAHNRTLVGTGPKQ